MSPISLRICKLDLTDTLIKLLFDCLFVSACLASLQKFLKGKSDAYE